MAKAATQTQPDQIKVVDTVEMELAALEAIWRALDSVQSETRRRILGFMKSKFNHEWPSDAY